MARLSASVRMHKRQHSSILSMVRAVAAALIEQHKSFVAQQGLDLAESDTRRGRAHLLYQLITPTHKALLSFLPPSLHSGSTLSILPIPA
jgi:hypothetical protein